MEGKIYGMWQVMTAIREVTEARARSDRMCITFSQWGRHDVGEVPQLI
jgi:hypothetical protein